MKSQWPMVKLGDVLNYEQPTHYIVNTTQYDDTYPIPVLTAGQTFILGYTNETENIYHKNLPVLIFDDFTTAIKYVDFPFKVKSSAMKILSNDKSKTSIKYLFYAMGRISIDTELHKRYWISLYSNISIPLPPLSVQLQIVQKLDKVQLLIEQRKYQIEKLDLLAKSRFIEMFGPYSQETTSAGSIMPYMRNGVSPSTHGKFHEKVLTLSAITPGNFDEKAWKDGCFVDCPPAEKRITASDFYMCRGNGNKTLVGVGVYSNEDHPDLVFPDTVIAARIDKQKICLPYLAFAWKMPSVRSQIECSARTTNGTYKINQQSISNIRLILPPISLQNEFASFIEELDKSKFTIRKSLEKLETLYRALLQEYFG